MNQNPFASNTYMRIWSKHFDNSKQSLEFNFIKHILFTKHNWFPLFFNVGNKLTNGNFYEISKVENDYKGKTFLIRDIPSYYNLHKSNSEELKIKSIFQYRGFTAKIGNYKNIEEYLRIIYKSNTRSKLRRNINRLESCFSVEYKMYFGVITDETYYSVFDSFYKLFEKRYVDKGEPCGELDPKVWAYYTELCLALIREEKGSLFVIYCDEVPVGITFSYHVNDILIEALTVFDIDYYRFNIGHTMILKMLDWSFKNNITLFDYTQGEFEYKKRWSDSNYNTYYHILYDSISLKSSLVANLLQVYFYSKRKFRELKLNTKYHKLKHKLFGTRSVNISPSTNFLIEVLSEDIPDFKNLESINFNDKYYTTLRRSLYDFLYKNPELARSIKVYKQNGNTYFAQCKTSLLKIIRDDK